MKPHSAYPHPTVRRPSSPTVLIVAIAAACALVSPAAAEIIEHFGFDTWTDGWAPTADSALQGITCVGLSATGAGVVTEGSYSLAIPMSLSTNPASKMQGRIIVDLADDPAFAVDAPLNLDEKKIYRNFRWHSNEVATSRRYRWFAGDISNKFTYEAWNVLSNYAYSSGFSFTIAATNANTDSGFDPTKIRYIGMDFALAEGSTTQAYDGYAHIDKIMFDTLPGAFEAPADQKYSYDGDSEGFQIQTWQDSQACTSLARVASAPSNSTGCLRVDVHMDAVTTNFAKGEVYVDMQNYPPAGASVPVDLKDKRVSAWIYCPAGLGGYSTNRNFIQIFCKDSSWRSFYGTPDHVTTGFWFQVSMTPDTNQALWGYMDSGFDPTQVRLVGVKIGAGDNSGWTYDGPMYVDGLRFEVFADTVETNDLQYGFEPNKQGWSCDTYAHADPYQSLTGIVSTARSTNYALEGTRSLWMDCDIDRSGTNRQKGAAKVDMVWYPPPTVRAPFDLGGSNIHAYIYCPAGSESTSPLAPNLAKLYVKSTNWLACFGAEVTMRDGEWIELNLAPATNSPVGGYAEPGFNPAEIIEMGVAIDMSGVYTGALYLDNVGFGAWPPGMDADSQHIYDQETAGQADWWKWETNPDGWNAKAWTNVYYATNEGHAASVALAAAAEFVVGGDDEFRKGVFEIAYQPALNLSTKDHRVIQARLRFDPAIEGLLSFSATLSVFDKVTDQWYGREFNIGDSSWNIIEFDLDNTNDYDSGSPLPMNTTAIGFINIQLYANVSWTGTVYLDEVVAGGKETGTNYTPVTTGFVRAQGQKFILDGSNFYHCGANIEYLQTVPDATVIECLDWAQEQGIAVVRTWAMQEGQPYSFQPERGVWNELMFEHLDRIVAEAGDRDIRLMLGLCDNWAHNGGIFQYVHWVTREHPDSVDTNLNPEGVEYHDQFWTNAHCRQWYRDYVTRLLNRTNTITGVRYKDDPTVFAWEIVNEPRCESDFSGAKIHDWLNTMSDWVRTIDTNHILSGGEEGGYVNTYDFADTVPWEVYPDNYYHYGVYGSGSPTCDLYGCGRGHGVDFLSDNRNEDTYVTWQDGFFTNPGTVYGEWRPGNSNLNFATCRIYIDQKEYNVWRTNLNSADQRIEWLNDHWYDAHRTIGKPLILEEFGIHANGWVFNGSYGQIQLVRTPAYTQQDRMDIYGLFYRYIEQVGMPASYFWNFGYDGMWNDRFHHCDLVEPWYPNTGDGSATNVAVSTAHVIQGTNSLLLQWNVPDTNSNKAIFGCPTNEMWVLRVDRSLTNDPPTKGVNRGKFFWNVYNPSDSNFTCALALRGTPDNLWAETPQFAITQGWNGIMFDLSAGTWSWQGNGWRHQSYLLDITNAASGTNVLEDVKEVNILFYNLPLGEGEVFIDDIQVKRDDGFVVYADDPVNAVISNHAARMRLRNVATNDPGNTVPVAGNITIHANPFVATNVDLTGFDADGDWLSYRIVSRPTNGWVFGIPPTGFVYKTMPGIEENDSFTYVAHDDRVDSTVATVTIIITNYDVDQDSLPDSYEFGLFPKRVQWWPYDSDNLTNLNGNLDWDGDGQNDHNEWYAGTDATNPGSLLYILGTNFMANGNFVIEWPSVGGKQYTLERSSNLVAGFDTPLATHIDALPPMNVYTDSTAVGLGPYLYRVEVE